MMECVASLVISAFQRPQLLNWGLLSLARQEIPFAYEIIVVNDGIEDSTRAICESYRSRLNIKYIFSGRRNMGGPVKWRVPGFAINIGARQALGKVLLISCAEIFHLNNTLLALVNPILGNNTLMTIPLGKDDRDGSFLNSVTALGGGYDPALYKILPDLDVRLPFLLALSKAHFDAIRGYDEDLVGIAFDDNDLVDRLQNYGLQYYQTGAKMVHLYHPRYVYDAGMSPDWHYNRHLYLTRGQKLVRNENREWGSL